MGKCIQLMEIYFEIRNICYSTLLAWGFTGDIGLQSKGLAHVKHMCYHWAIPHVDEHSLAEAKGMMKCRRRNQSRKWGEKKQPADTPVQTLPSQYNIWYFQWYQYCSCVSKLLVIHYILSELWDIQSNAKGFA